jgi:L-rhamnose-H+ transport protein
MVVIPAIVIGLLLNGPLATLQHVLHQRGPLPVVAPVFFGFLWGTGFVLFTIVLKDVGFSLTYAIVFGLINLFGSILPLAMENSAKILTPGGKIVLLGIAVCTLGVAAVGYAGVLRDQPKTSGRLDSSFPRRSLGRILVLCLITGFFCACPNLGFTIGAPVQEASEKVFGNPSSLATFAIWMLVFAGGFLAAGSYSFGLLVKNRSWGHFAGSHVLRNLGLATAVAVIHFGIFTSYGVGAYLLGPLGKSVGWAVQFSLALIVANVFGFATGEWRGASPVSLRWILGGIGLLILSSVILTVGSTVAG